MNEQDEAEQLRRVQGQLAESMTDYTDPESPVADPHAEERLHFRLPWRGLHCMHCGLIEREHINGYFCPEWRLRQLDGDR